MKILLLFTLVTATVSVGGVFHNKKHEKETFMKIKQVHYKYDPFLNGFWQLPKTVNEDKKFQFVARDEDLNLDLYSYPNDPRFFVLFDTYGNVAGIRIGYIKKDLPKRAEKKSLVYPYKFEDRMLFDSGNYWDTDIFYTTILFDDPEVFRAGGRKDTKGIVVEDAYLRMHGKWTKMPRDECDAEEMGFTKQACFYGMGMHYFYKMSKTLACEDFEGAFLLYENGELVGLGMVPFGTFNSKDRTWNEDPTATVLKMIVPHRPKCLADWVTKYGTVSLHIFFSKHPRLTSCAWTHQRKLNCKK